MGNETELPDKVGQRGEARSFLEGYRGAWFGCEILEVATCIDGVRRLLLKYYDFDDDTPEWLKLYTRPPWKSKYTKELMLRPPYPPVHNANKIPHASEISQVSVIVDDSWKVGDLVDWYTTGSYWCGTITKLLGDARAEFQLPKQPHGEDLVYEIELKDVRPSLDWSPEHGWTMPTPTREGESGSPSAWLLKPINRDAGRPQIMDTLNLGKETETGKGATASASSSRSTLHCASSDTIEAAVMDLEDLANKVRWLKKFLMRSMSMPVAPENEWEFLEPQDANASQAKGD